MRHKHIDILYLSQDDVEKTGLTMKETIGIVEKAYGMYAKGEVTNPPKVILHLDQFNKPRSMFVAQPAYAEATGKACVKWAGINYENKKLGYLTHVWVIVLSDGANQMPLAVMDGTYITSMRTGAATAIGIKYLGRRDASTITMVGIGGMASHQIEAISEVVRAPKILIPYNISGHIKKDASESFAKEMSNKLGLDIQATNDLENSVRKSEIIVLSSSANEPIIRYNWLREGALVCAIGVFQECDWDTAKKADRIVVDHHEQWAHMGELQKWASDGLITRDDIDAIIGDIVVGKKPGREKLDEKILYVPIGMGTLDVTTANWVYEKAKEMKIGLTLPLL